MRNHQQADRLRAARFQEAQRLIEGSRQTLEQTRQLLHQSDRLLRENSIVLLLHPDDESNSDEAGCRKPGNRR
jgi:hypothetical protein